MPYSYQLGKVHHRFETPANALILECALAVIYIFSGTFNTLTNMLIFVLWIFFVMGVFGIFILRRREDPTEKKNYRVPLYPFTPIVAILGGIYILGSTILSSPLNSIIGIAITLAGLPIFYYLKRKNNRNIN